MSVPSVQHETRVPTQPAGPDANPLQKSLHQGDPTTRAASMPVDANAAGLPEVSVSGRASDQSA